jgi:hypothetical protein
MTALGLVVWALWLSEPDVPLRPAAYFQTEEGCLRAARKVEKMKRAAFALCIDGDYMPPQPPALPKGKVTL